MNADSYASTGQGFLGYNMFAYCENNPITGLDYSGHLRTFAVQETDGYKYHYTKKQRSMMNNPFVDYINYSTSNTGKSKKVSYSYTATAVLSVPDDANCIVMHKMFDEAMTPIEECIEEVSIREISVAGQHFSVFPYSQCTIYEKYQNVAIKIVIAVTDNGSLSDYVDVLLDELAGVYLSGYGGYYDIQNSIIPPLR